MAYNKIAETRSFKSVRNAFPVVLVQETCKQGRRPAWLDCGMDLFFQVVDSTFLRGRSKGREQEEEESFPLGSITGPQLTHSNYPSQCHLLVTSNWGAGL